MLNSFVYLAGLLCLYVVSLISHVEFSLFDAILVALVTFGAEIIWARSIHKTVTQKKQPVIPAPWEIVSREESFAIRSKILKSRVKHACHTMLYTKVPKSKKLWSSVSYNCHVLMVVRFDGQFGFPGGFVDDPDKETLEEAANRELKEEISDKIKVNSNDYFNTCYLKESNMCTHLFAKEIDEKTFRLLEKDAINAPDRHEVWGAVRVSLYKLKNNKGLPYFMQQKFAGNCLQQLLNVIYTKQLMNRQEFLTIVDDLAMTKLLYNYNDLTNQQ